jgi:site-specific recombinase XerD
MRDSRIKRNGGGGRAWVAEVAEEWIGEIRPLIGRSDGSPALWPTERADRISLEYIDHRFQAARGALGLPDGLDFHSLRRSYVTHLIEDGWDPFFVQQQVGHEHASTTSIYTCVSSDFRVKTLRSALDATVTAAMGKHPAAGPGEPRQAALGSRQTVGEQARDAR